MQEAGHSFLIDGHHELHYGSLTTVSADNPASCALGGFKESTSAYRQCMSTRDEFAEKVHVACWWALNRPSFTAVQ